MVGREDVVKAACDAGHLSGERIEIVPAAEVVEMNESGILAVRQKRNSSMSIAVDLVKAGDAQAVVSAGNTGAAVAASTIKLRLLKGVEKAGIVSQLPNEYGICNVTDTGANPDAKPRHVVGYAVMASVLANKIYGKARPKVGVMSNGSEDEKGNEFSKATFHLLKHLEAERELPFEFIGNVEGHDLFEHEVDVVLTDGFTGNVLLKTCEATAKAFSKWLKKELMSSTIRKTGALLSAGAYRAMKERLSAESVGGSPLLGVNGVSIIAHGSSSGLAICNALRVAKEMLSCGVNPLIEEHMERLGRIPDLDEETH
jgi:glycerol-3-phosphate acyltransferase PlsX